MVRRLARYGVLLAMIAVGLLLCLDVAYFVHGSLEEFPTEEQEDKVRRVSAVIAAILVVAEVGLWSVLRHLSAAQSRTRA
jgi:hypothetical protein